MKKRSKLKRRTPLQPSTTPIPKINKERAKKKHERNFGDKADFVRGFPCAVTSRYPVHAAHTKARGMGGAKGSKEDLVPLHPEVHDSFDNESAKRFEERWGYTKEDVRALAPFYNSAFRKWSAENSSGDLSF